MGALQSALRATVIAGLAAAALASVFHQVLTEPVIDRAIAAEEARAASEPGHVNEEPVVSRGGQKIGLVVGLLIYGLVWGLLVGVGLYATRDLAPPGWSLGRRGLVVAALAGWSVALFPFLKYPANPPGVGDPGTIGYRQTLYVGFIGLAVVGLFLAASLRRHVTATGAGAWIVPVAFYALWALAIYALMPSSSGPVEVAAATVRPFRALAFAGLVVFWSGFALVVAYLGRERSRIVARAAR